MRAFTPTASAAITTAIACLFLMPAGLVHASPLPGLSRAPRPADAPGYDASVLPPGPDDLTWAEAWEIERGSSSSFRGESPAVDRAGSVRAPDAIEAAGGQSCRIDTGAVYKRKSGRTLPYGAVGGHPSTQCTVVMARISQSTDLYKTVWWGLQKVAGPFDSTNTGQGRLQQTSPIRRCDDLRDTTFRMIVRSTGTFPTGATGTASAFEEADLACGTNP
jgi:hypothetical protein